MREWRTGVGSSCAPYRFKRPDRTIREWIGATTDIDERKRAERERAALLDGERNARHEAEEALRTRDDFLSIASHELNTPLTPIKLQIGSMRRHLPEEQASLLKQLAIVDRQVDRLKKLISELLDVSRIGNGRLEMYPEPTDLHELLSGVIERFSASGVEFAAPRRVARHQCGSAAPRASRHQSHHERHQVWRRQAGRYCPRDPETGRPESRCPIAASGSTRSSKRASSIASSGQCRHATTGASASAYGSHDES